VAEMGGTGLEPLTPACRVGATIDQARRAQGNETGDLQTPVRELWNLPFVLEVAA
jgi:hypothetical protein